MVTLVLTYLETSLFLKTSLAFQDYQVEFLEVTAPSCCVWRMHEVWVIPQDPHPLTPKTLLFLPTVRPQAAVLGPAVGCWHSSDSRRSRED